MLHMRVSAQILSKVLNKHAQYFEDTKSKDFCCLEKTQKGLLC